MDYPNGSWVKLEHQETFEQDKNGFSKAIYEEKQKYSNDKKEENEEEQEQMKGISDDQE
ncbi:hypothetical protein OXYTRIMIC_269 [Oxytricha trifallax]|uniref:Uncharacterized protein n=1 Tax=Oxytricha trifallax TaxID=1172189 RepID=A0A073HXK5_9SPIT|nr:hypothetical protein OXYTRIMIC_269 [Oxytricha trifallax]